MHPFEHDHLMDHGVVEGETREHAAHGASASHDELEQELVLEGELRAFLEAFWEEQASHRLLRELFQE